MKVNDYFKWDELPLDHQKSMQRFAKVMEMLSHNFPVDLGKGDYLCMDDKGDIAIAAIGAREAYGVEPKDKLWTVKVEYVSYLKEVVGKMTEEQYREVTMNYNLNCVMNVIRSKYD